MTRILGACTVLGIGILAAWSTAQKEHKRLLVLEAWISLLYYVRNQIDCFSLPLHQILSTADRSVLNTLAHGCENPSLEKLRLSSAPFLDAECQKLLNGLIDELGTSYRQEQVKRCDYYLKELQLHRDKAKQSLPMRQKMLVTLHLCAGLGAVILLW